MYAKNSYGFLWFTQLFFFYYAVVWKSRIYFVQIKIYCVSYVCLHYSALNGKVATLSREGKVRGVQTERGETSEGGSVQGGKCPTLFMGTLAWAQGIIHRRGCTLAPPDEYDRMICAAAVMRTVAIISIDNLFNLLQGFRPILMSKVHAQCPHVHLPACNLFERLYFWSPDS